MTCANLVYLEIIAPFLINVGRRIMMMMMILRKALPTIGVNAIMATIDATTMMMAMMIREEESCQQ